MMAYIKLNITVNVVCVKLFYIVYLQLLTMFYVLIPTSSMPRFEKMCKM